MYSLAVEESGRQCELISGGFPRHLNIFLTHLLLLYTIYKHINTCYVFFVLLTVIPCRISYSFLEDLITLHKRTLQQIFLVKDQLQPPLDMVTVNQE